MLECWNKLLGVLEYGSMGVLEKRKLFITPPLHHSITPLSNSRNSHNTGIISSIHGNREISRT
jgi:hypothetical protein